MRKNIAAVIAAFQAGRAHREATCSTDGERIYSYALPIALRRDDGVFIIRPERLSRTTASQVRACWLAMPGATSLPAPVPRPIVHPCPTAPHVGTGGHGY